MSSRVRKPEVSLRSRPRRNRASEAIRGLVRETVLRPEHFILPLFVCEGKGVSEPISSMPGQSRLSIDLLVKKVKEASAEGVRAVALFPKISDILKDTYAKESLNKDGLLQRAVRELKNACPDVLVITDVAMDPYSSDGHDGVVRDGVVVNDETLPILVGMAVSQVEAGADWVAPSDMMDGRVGYIRRALDDAGFADRGILAYTAKYASAFYGPFRQALDSAPRAGDKKTYQMDPANRREALREAVLDVAEGADVIMVKPALAYLDVISELRRRVSVPVAAYQVSGEYAMIKAASQLGWLDEERAMMEALLAIRRAGADMILSYYALDAARILQR
ncbi:MAG: porphobilinogen synthase [Bdellovibrionales bacterium]|jgi:porphobilinogen synthase|nr:porphobilinogen synthase [Bdellovibrionales bacterium]